MPPDRMQLFIDESCDYSIVNELRETGLNVVSVLEDFQGTSDQQILEIASRNDYIIVTEDHDFGRKIFVEGQYRVAVILLRYTHKAVDHISDSLCELFQTTVEEKLQNSFIVVRPDNVRFHKLPS